MWIHISNPTGVCGVCRQGLKSDALPGVVKQASERYPGITFRFTAEEANAAPRKAELVVRNGKIDE